MENDFNFDFDKKLNIKKVIFVGIVALFLLVILIELISTPFKKKKEQDIENSNPNSSFSDSSSLINLTLSKKYELTKYTPSQNYLLELRSPNDLNIFIAKKDFVDDRNLLDIVSADKRSYIEEFSKYSNLSDITEITTGINLPAYTYCFHYLDSKLKKSFYLQIIWIQAEDGYYIIDVEFPLDDISSYSSIITDVANSFKINEV